MNEFDNDIGDVERTNRVNHAFHLALKSSKKFLSEEICNQVVIMGKKETKIILDQSDDQCMVELEPLNPDEEKRPDSPWKRHNEYQEGSSANSSIAVPDCDDCESKLRIFYNRNKTTIKYAVIGVLAILFFVYFVFACYLDHKRARDLIIITAASVFFIIYYQVKGICGNWTYENVCLPVTECIQNRWKILRWIVYITLLALIGIFIGMDTINQPKRLISIAGLVMYILICYLCSKHRKRVNWRPVLWGLGIQFTLGFIILRTRPGYQTFRWIGDRVSNFLSFSDSGAQFLFGKESYLYHPFAFKVLPVVIFFSAFINMVYYLGVMQAVIKRIAWLMQCTLGTSAAESLNTAGNIFVGQTEAPLLIRPFIADLTLSELHAVMTSGFATIAGSVLGAYIHSGVSATHLISACVLNAPAALAVSKLVYPETDEPKTKDVDKIEIDGGKEKNLIEALASGASMSIVLVANIAVNLIAFVAILAFVDGILMWLGGMVGKPDLSFELIASYLCMPFAYMMGVEWNDAFKVGQLLGVKTFLNEFVAYEKLAVLIKNRKENLAGTVLSLRSETIVTYALCGFANIASVGVQIGGISALAPKRAPDLAKIAPRALWAGTIACFLTACVAGILFDENLEQAATIATTMMPNATSLLNNTTPMPLMSSTMATNITSLLNTTLSG